MPSREPEGVRSSSVLLELGGFLAEASQPGYAGVALKVLSSWDLQGESPEEELTVRPEQWRCFSINSTGCLSQELAPKYIALLKELAASHPLGI